MTLDDDLGERQHSPSVAPRAVGVEPVAVLVQVGDGAEVDHGESPAEAKRPGGIARAGPTGFLTTPCHASEATFMHPSASQVTRHANAPGFRETERTGAWICYRCRPYRSTKAVAEGHIIPRRAT